MFDSQPAPSSPDADFKAFIADPKFPCVGAKSAVAHDRMEICLAGSLLSPDADRRVVSRLQKFAAEAQPDQMYLSFVVIFSDEEAMPEAEFETALWARLQSYHEIDSASYDWDPAVSSDPENPAFSLSIGGKAFYVVGLHPGASRLGRRFMRPALVFNLHNQFENLRGSGTYDKFRKTILDRDVKLNGSLNPMLKVHGEASEAVQYSGRHVEGAWKCPFHAAHKGQI